MKTNDVVTVIEKDFPKGYLIPSQKGDTMAPSEYTFADVKMAVDESQEISRRDLRAAIDAELRKATSEDVKRALASVWNQHLKDTK